MKQGDKLLTGINYLISQYGHTALIVDNMTEGETIILLGGVTVHQGLLKSPLVVITVALDGVVGDQLLHLVGRRFGERTLRRSASQRAQMHKAQYMIQHRSWLFVIGTRSTYGFRVIDPLLIDVSRLSSRIFLLSNTVGALVQALPLITVGYLGGGVVGPWLHHLDAYLKHWTRLILAIGLMAAIHWWLRR